MLRTVVRRRIWRGSNVTALLSLPVPHDMEAVGAARQLAHVHDTNMPFHQDDPARENRIGYAVEATFAQWSGLPLPAPWDGRIDAGYEFVAPAGRVNTKGAAKHPWMLPVRKHHYDGACAEFYVLAYVSTDVRYLGWTTHAHLKADGFWYELPRGPARCIRVEYLNASMTALRHALGLSARTISPVTREGV